MFNRSIDTDENIKAEILKDLITGKRKKKYFLIKVFEENNDLTKQQEGQKYSKSTVQQYGTALTRLKEFLQDKYNVTDIELDKLDVNFIRRFEIYLRTKYGNGDNTTMKYLKQLKKVVHYAMELGYLDRDPFRSYSTPFSEVNRGYLTTDELKRIEEKKFRITRLVQVCTNLCVSTNGFKADVFVRTVAELAKATYDLFLVNSMCTMRLKSFQRYHKQ